MGNFWCKECEQIGPEGIPDDRTVILDFAGQIGLVDAAGKPTAVGAALVLDFYGRLLGAGGEALARRFPQDLLDANAALDGAGAKQRDRLLQAVLAVATLWDPGNEERMRSLDAALDAMASQHTKHGATLQEYALVEETLRGVFESYARTAQIPRSIWKRAYEPALRRALTYTSGRMMCGESKAVATSS